MTKGCRVLNVKKEEMSTQKCWSVERAPRVAQQSCLVQTTPRSWLEHWPSVAFLGENSIWQNLVPGQWVPVAGPRSIINLTIAPCVAIDTCTPDHNNHCHWMVLSSFLFEAWDLFGPIHLPPFLHSFWQTGSLKDKIIGCRKWDAIMLYHFILVQIFQVEYWFKMDFIFGDKMNILWGRICQETEERTFDPINKC